MPICRSLEMSISREEFLRLLPRAVGPYALSDGDRIEGGDSARRWTIHLQRLEDRSLGSVILSRHQVELQFEGFSEAEVTFFLAQFQRGFQRGGG